MSGHEREPEERAHGTVPAWARPSGEARGALPNSPFVKTKGRSRRWTQPEPGDTLESIAARELSQLAPADALRSLQSWNLHLMLRPFPRGSLIGADIVYLEPPLAR